MTAENWRQALRPEILGQLGEPSLPDCSKNVGGHRPPLQFYFGEGEFTGEPVGIIAGVGVGVAGGWTRGRRNPLN
jgi:hypothetical protein